MVLIYHRFEVLLCNNTQAVLITVLQAAVIFIHRTNSVNYICIKKRERERERESSSSSSSN